MLVFFYLTPTGSAARPPPPSTHNPLCSMRSDLSRMRLLRLPLLNIQLWGVISIPFLGHWLCEARSHWQPLGATGSHWEPLGATRTPILPPQEKPAKSPIRPLHQRRPSSLGSGAVVPHPDVFPHTRYPESLKKPERDKERLFPDCRREEKGGRFVKY